MREESRYHYLHTLITMANHKLERAELETKYQRGEQRMMRDFGSLKDLFTVGTFSCAQIFLFVSDCLYSFLIDAAQIEFTRANDKAA